MYRVRRGLGPTTRACARSGEARNSLHRIDRGDSTVSGNQHGRELWCSSFGGCRLAPKISSSTLDAVHAWTAADGDCKSPACSGRSERRSRPRAFMFGVYAIAQRGSSFQCWSLSYRGQLGSSQWIRCSARSGSAPDRRQRVSPPVSVSSPPVMVSSVSPPVVVSSFTPPVVVTSGTHAPEPRSQIKSLPH